MKAENVVNGVHKKKDLSSPSTQSKMGITFFGEAKTNDAKDQMKLPNFQPKTIKNQEVTHSTVPIIQFISAIV